MKVRINSNKRIGRVVFLTEGPKDEPNLLEAIFCDVLGYDVAVYDKRNGSTKRFVKRADPYSRIYVAAMPTSSIKNLPITKDYEDEIYNALKQYGLQMNEAAVFYLFDRDYQSNKQAAVESSIGSLRNPYDNGESMAGALLLSYPCLQAYYCEAHGIDVAFDSSHEAKVYVNTNSLKDLNDRDVYTAASDMLGALKEIRRRDFAVSELDDYSLINRDVYRYEEARRATQKYRTLCLLSLALFDLGVLEIDA